MNARQIDQAVAALRRGGSVWVHTTDGTRFEVRGRRGVGGRFGCLIITDGHARGRYRAMSDSAVWAWLSHLELDEPGGAW